MPRLSVPLTDEQHTAIKVKAAQVGLAQAEVARRLLLAWERGDEDETLKLWRRLLEWIGDDPWHEINYGLDFSCFFCGEDRPNHEPDCIYLVVKKLIEGDE
jgi:hypothetical protein